MGNNAFTRQYIMLRPACGKGSGFARVEVSRGQGKIVLHGTVLPAGQNLRALLIAGRGESCVLDLGTAEVTASGCLDMNREHLSLPMLRGYDAVALTTDWPEGRIILYGHMMRSGRCSLWQMQEALDRYLRLPCEDMKQQPKSGVPERQTEDSADPFALPKNSLLRLKRLIWPACPDLRAYFDAYPPCMPFDAPGWRFVRVPLSPENGVEGILGRHIGGQHVDGVAYAVPGKAGDNPPEGWQGCIWQQDRTGQGYWLRIDRV